MKIEITDLSNTPISELTRCFNESFSDYFIKINATESYLEKRWRAGRVKYELSFGYFIDDILRGFIIHGIDMRDGKLTAHNCATGIEPPFRGHGILGKMYEAAMPFLREKGVNFSTLEVISQNGKAIRAYQKAGFQLRPTLLHCFKGSPQIKIQVPENVLITKTTLPDFLFYESCRDFEPTWEMTESAFSVFLNEFEFSELFLENNKIGYLIFSPSTNSVQQFAIQKEHRNKGYGKIIFQHLTQEYNNIRVNNVPETSINTVNFLKNIGMEIYTDQYEMEREI